MFVQKRKREKRKEKEEKKMRRAAPLHRRCWWVLGTVQSHSDIPKSSVEKPFQH